jgi:hypothetical protein
MPKARRGMDVMAGELNKNIFGNLLLFRVFISAIYFYQATPALCETLADKPDEKAEARMSLAFESGLGESATGKTPLFLESERFGHHWRFTGYKRNGASVKQLSCLLCTQQEAALAAAYLGDTLGRQYRDEPTPPRPPLTEAVMSIDGAPVSAEALKAVSTLFESPSPKRYRWRLRGGIAAAGIGAAAAVLGGMFIWMDGRCAKKNCELLHQNLKGPGIGLTISGALLETAALLLCLIKRPSEETP